MRIRPAILTLLAAAIFARVANAAPEGHYHWISPMVGWTQLSKNLAYPGRDSLKSAAALGLRLGTQLDPNLGLELAGHYTSTKEAGGPGRKVTLMGGSANLMYTPQMWAPGGIYFEVGGGANARNSSGFKRVNYATFEQAAGWAGWFNDHAGYRLEARNIMNLPHKDLASARRNDQQYWFGLTLGMGGKPVDTDGDGVPDKKDRCPNTPAGAHVDLNGCPIDSDHDGVVDGLDQCADTPMGASVDPRGCPKDSDGDGVYDGLDKCPDTPKGAKVDATGCPLDSDRDGVYDGIDQCPNTPSGAKVDASGCPTDADGDGVYDGLDKCPDTPTGAKVDAEGCPIVVSERETELLDTGMIRLQNVNFETGKATLLPESLPILDEVGPILRKWPQLKIEVGGHTDSRGTDAKNQVLSEARANSVRDYLVHKYPDIVPDQLTAKGYGESRPIAPNKGALNMAKNRRVEFVVLNKDVLKREVERRRLLEKSGSTTPPSPDKLAPGGSAPPSPAPSNPSPPSPAPADTTHR